MTPDKHKNIESIAAGLVLGVVLTWASRTFGLTWDECNYFKFSDSIRDWFLNHRSVDEKVIAAYWGYSTYHNPHPPFMKILNALTSVLFSGRIAFPASYRIAGILYVSTCAALSWRLLRSSFSFPATAAAIGFVCLQPRVFGHLMIAATDSPVAMSWLVLTLIVWRLDQTPVASHRPVLRLLFFLLLGMASATKINGFLAVFPLAAYLLSRRNYRECWWLVRAALFALLFVLLVSPPLWRHPAAGIGHYLYYPFLRPTEAISSFYLGRFYTFYLPWHYFSVMTLAVLPLILLFSLSGLIFVRKLALYGLLRAILFPLGFWLIIAHLPATPKHDGIRQLLSIYPFIGLLSWLGLSGWLWRLERVARLPGRRLLQPAIIASLLTTLSIGVVRAHPFELSFYNSLIGGLKGAEKKGLEISYYLEAIYPDFIRRIDPYLQNGKRIYMMPPWPYLLERYRQQGLLTGDFTALATPVNFDYLLILRRRGFVKDALYTKIPPLLEVTRDGVSIVKFSESRNQQDVVKSP